MAPCQATPLWGRRRGALMCPDKFKVALCQRIVDMICVER